LQNLRELDTRNVITNITTYGMVVRILMWKEKCL
jgi:hypothetical protein